MIPVLTTMLGLLTVAVCGNLIRQEQDRTGGGTVVSFLAVFAIIGAILGTGYVWYLSMQLEQLWP